MQVKSRVLMLGHETTLLETRARILELAGYQVSPVLVIGPAESALSSGTFDLSILCNTLSSEQRLRFLAGARALRPAMKALILVDDRSMELPLKANENTFCVFDGPRRLVAAVDRILSASEVDCAMDADPL